MRMQESNRSSDGDAGSPNPVKPLKRRRRRRWPYMLLVVVVVIVALIGLTPYLASTAAGTRLIARTVNNRIQGTVRIGDLSLNWTGPSELREVTIKDTAGREVLKTRRITYHGGLWTVLQHIELFDQVEIDTPKADLYADADGQISLLRALQPRTPARRDERLPQPRGRVVVRSGEVRLLPQGAVPYLVEELNGELALDTLSHVNGTFSFDLPGGGVFKGDASIRDLVGRKGLDFFGAKGQFHVMTEGNIDAGSIVTLLAPTAQTSGSCTLDVKGNFDGGTMDAALQLRVSGLQTRRANAAEMQPIDLQLAGNIGGTRAEMNGSITLSGEPGKLQTKFRLRPETGRWDVAADQLLATVLTGASLNLPEFQVESSGEMDLPRLARAVPGLMRLREDVRITAGRFALRDMKLQGGRSPAAAGSIELTEIRGNRGDRAFTIEPINLAFDVLTRPEEPMQIRKASASSGFGQGSATGTATQMDLNASADLARFQKQVAQILETRDMQLAGQIVLTSRATRENDKRINLTVHVTGDGVEYRTANARLHFDKATIAERGHLTLDDTRVIEIMSDDGQVNLDDQIVIATGGTYRFTTGGFDARATIKRGDGRYARVKVAEISGRPPGDRAGTLAGDLSAKREAASGPVVTQGKIVVQAQSPRNERDEVEVIWRDGEWLPSGGWRIDSASMTGDFGTADVRGLRLSPDGAATGELKATADLARLFRTVQTFTTWEKPPRINGKIAIEGSLGSKDGLVQIDGKGHIDDFVVGTGDSAIHEKRADFASKAQLDRKREQIKLESVTLHSRLLKFAVTGAIDHYATTRELDLHCEYSAEWEPLMALLKQFAPSTSGKMLVRGSTGGRFQVAGPLKQPGVGPVWRGVKAQLPVKWSSGKLLGLDLLAGTLEPKVSDGWLIVPPSSVSAGGGHMNLAGKINLAGPHPILEIPEQLSVLDNIPINAQLSHDLLSHLNPLFAGVSEIQGNASLLVRSVRLPLGGDMRDSRGSGRLTTSQIRLQPKGFLNELVKLGSLAGQRFSSGMLETRMSDLNFTMDGGRIRYNDFTVYLLDNQLDLKFYGSIGFQGDLDLMVSVPVRSGLLEQFGVSGPVTEYARALEGMRVELPVTGTTEQPHVDLAKVDIKQLLAKAAAKTLTNTAQQTIGRIAGQPTGPGVAPTGQNGAVPASPQDTAKTIIGGLLGQPKNKDQNRDRRDPRR